MHFVALAILLCGSVAYGAVLPKGLVPVPDGRIFGGVEAKLGQFPYQASMRFWGLHRCGAVVYRHDAVLTAAHCTYELTADLLEVAMGTIYRNRFGEERWVRLIINHENFNPNTFVNDVAILILDHSVDFSGTIQPIPLASVGEDVKAGTVMTVSGWGSLNDEGHLPDALQFVNVQIVDRAACAAAYKDEIPVTTDMICAGVPEGGKDACSGDSGGPLVVQNKLYGLVSWGAGCGDPEYPGVYTNVAVHRDWVNKQFN